MQTTFRLAQNTTAAIQKSITDAKEKAARNNKPEGWAIVARVELSDPALDIRFDAGMIMSNGDRFFFSTPRRTWNDKDGKEQSVRTVQIGQATTGKILEAFEAFAKARNIDDLIGGRSAASNTFTL